MTTATQTSLQLIANTIRGLSIDAIDAANSGHPGLPLGCAELGAYLFAEGLRFNPENPKWINRDRFVLSAGHGSMLLYSALHLAGYAVSLDDLKKFRQLHSPTAGHPEYNEAPGIETTTGPLGQGIANGIGMALANKMVEARCELQNTGLLDGKVVILAGDGCMMEGVSAEASSFAGHLGLDNVILIYDANSICLDGPIDECFTENVAQRYEAYGWAVQTIDGHNFEAIQGAFEKAKKAQGKPQLIIAKTVIGKGSPTYQGTADVHGKALGAEENKKTKEALGLPTEPAFYVPAEVRQWFDQKKEARKAQEAEWHLKLADWKRQHSDKAQLWDALSLNQLPSNIDQLLLDLPLKSNMATRQISGLLLQVIHDALPTWVGGSADLSCSDNSFMKGSGAVKPGQFAGRNIKYGVREFAMSAISNGIALQGMLRPFCATFFTFSDYMRNAIRLAALMQLPVVYQFTHDSIFLGEDGPTHQPIEHLASLRAMPNLMVIRPADANETRGAWMAALKSKTPVALVLSRQGLPDLEGTKAVDVAKGAYVVLAENQTQRLDVTVLSTGSELHVAIEAAKQLSAEGKSVRVVSMPSFELFDKQGKSYQDSVLGKATLTVSLEAGATLGWHKYVGRDGLAIGVDSFGKSAPAKDLAKDYGLTVEAVVLRIKEALNA